MIRKELIGLTCEIVDARNHSLIGMKGKIIDETKNTLVIKNKTTKKIIKNQVKMKVDIKKKSIIIDGKELVGRPDERIKK